jgi:hypothetical protein
MNFRYTFLIVVGVWLTIGISSAVAAWPKNEASLKDWQGEKSVNLKTHIDDPLASSEVHNLIQRLIVLGYRVTLNAQNQNQALILDFRIQGQTSVLLLTQAADGVILALEQRRAIPQAPDKQQPALAMAASKLPGQQTSFLALNTSQKRLTYLGRSADGVSHRIALLSDYSVSVYELSDRFSLEKVADFTPSIPNLKALYVDSGDLDNDGNPEVVVVWAENNLGDYDGINSQLHSWILSLNAGELEVQSDDLEAFARLHDGKVYLQSRGRFHPFKEGVYTLNKSDRGFVASSSPVPWGDGDLYQLTPIDGDDAISWVEKNKLLKVARHNGTMLSANTYIEDLGIVNKPDVAVRLETPEFRSGFAITDQIRERYYPLSRRVVIDKNNERTFTIQRGRKPERFLGEATGSDSVVSIHWADDAGYISRPFPSVDAFILDFSLVPLAKSKSPIQTILLLNEHEDGTGKSYLHIQTSHNMQ